MFGFLIFGVFHSLCLPPEECSRGTRPSQAAKSRPRRTWFIGSAKVSIIKAPMGSTPGMACYCRGMAACLDKVDVSTASGTSRLLDVFTSISPAANQTM